MSALSIRGSVATHEDILRLDERLAAVTRMLNWIFMLQVAMTVGFMGAMVAFIAPWFQINT